MATEMLAYDKKELLAITRSFKAMDVEATNQAKVVSSQLADYVKSSVVDAAALSSTNQTAKLRIATGAVVSKSSKIGEITYGFARQKFSGGGTSQQLWAGNEFGSNTKKQFPVWSGREGRGSRGWFIYPTLRRIQPDIVKRWENAFVTVIKEFN
jgi:nucleoside diphosphate kinase